MKNTRSRIEVDLFNVKDHYCRPHYTGESAPFMDVAIMRTKKSLFGSVVYGYHRDFKKPMEKVIGEMEAGYTIHLETPCLYLKFGWEIFK